MVSLLPIPELQFIDANGVPLASGTIDTYIPNTTTPKTTYSDTSGTANTNPIVLNAAGRTPPVFGSGDYRFVVKDSLGNLVYDQLTSSTLGESAISAVMLPVVGAATLATARSLMGIDAAISAAIAGVSLLPGPTGPQGPQGIQGIQGTPGTAGSGYQPGFVGTNPGYLTLPNLNGTISNCFIQFGVAVTDSSGFANISFAIGYPNAIFSVVATATRQHTWINVVSQFNAGFSVVSSSPDFGGSWNKGPVSFNFIAIGY